MTPTHLVALQSAGLRFGTKSLFNDLSFGLARGERACLVGRNGSGKSTLLKVIAGWQEIDEGERFVQPGCTVAYLPQDPVFEKDGTVFDHVKAGLRPEMADADYMVDAILAPMNLPGERLLAGLSGGEGRRAALARALISEPDVLLMDEPTNHLDLPTIQWLEEELGRFKGALMVISHDRTFLNNLTRQTFWLDRGQIFKNNKGFEDFDRWSEELREKEEQELYRLNKQIQREEHWLQRGVTARRKRNMGRLRNLHDLRQKRAEWMRAPGTAKLQAETLDTGGDKVIEAMHISKSYLDKDSNQRTILRDFSTKIKRGDRIGIVGPNGAGKSTLVKTLIGRQEPDSGSIKLGTNLTLHYFDQKREDLKLDDTLWETLAPEGGDSIMVRGQQKHVVSYLKDFLFDEGQARQPVHALSGGEKNRLLLARMLAQPSNFMVLDEPTNDLDMDTLDLLVEMLDDYEGTLMIVSHDRDFLDRLATAIYAVEGDGEVVEYAGGYSDYLAQKALSRQEEEEVRKTEKAKIRASEPAIPARKSKQASKLSYKEQRELDGLPALMEELTGKLDSCQDELGQADLFTKDPDRFARLTRLLEDTQTALEEAEERWLELEEKQEALQKG
ncbi:ATP-binding cassette domain-containing protein [Kiloniella sp. b19]|uniref:ATP-binding cassette domain-containing protein n=1 Tax=Kiloniella sp. GXU_MW_B19 TaxID=3141326 RepID=UPI0031DAB240